MISRILKQIRMEENIENVILFQIDKTSKIAKLYSQREFDRMNLGITIEQWILLKIIGESTELSQKELAIKSLRDPASITRTLDILEKKQFILRKTISSNRRQYAIALSEKGKKFVMENMDTIVAHRKLSIAGFKKEELKLLTNMLKRIQKNMA